MRYGGNAAVVTFDTVTVPFVPPGHVGAAVAIVAFTTKADAFLVVDTVRFVLDGVPLPAQDVLPKSNIKIGRINALHFAELK